MFVDTPEQYNQLQQGQFNTLYDIIHITSDAHPNVLLQPQHFADAPFKEIWFISSTTDGYNMIKISSYNQNSATSKSATIKFNRGENPLSGIPKNCGLYSINYDSASIPIAENIDSILQWNEMETLTIYDQHNVTGSLLERIDEMSKLPKLTTLILSIQPQSYDQVNVTRFIKKLPKLKMIRFRAIDLTDEQLKVFYDKNPAPSRWRSRIEGNSIDYHIKTENCCNLM